MILLGYEILFSTTSELLTAIHIYYTIIIKLMGAFLSQANCQKKFQEGHNNDISYVAVQMQGWRVQMQDAILCDINIDKTISKSDGNSLFAVFDGHGGFQVSNFVKEVFISVLTETEQYKDQKYSQALKKTFQKIDQLIHTSKGEERLQQIKCEGGGNQVAADEKISDNTGCTACVALITKKQIYVANVGDSRCAIFSKETFPLSQDHKPENENQLKRIQNAGGQVAVGRVNGGVNLSRALGDFSYKANQRLPWNQQMISPQPDIKIMPRSFDDEFLLIGCDGVWQRYENESSGLMLRIKATKQFGEGDYQKCLSDLFEDMVAPNTKTTQFGLDNMSAILVKFHQL